MNLIFKIVSITTIISFTSCHPKYYIPNTQNVPLLKEQKQLNLSVAGNSNQLEAQGAYGLTNHLAVMVNAALYIPKDDGNGNGGSGKLAEIGLGYYTPVAENFIFETYGLFGVGTVENYFPSTVIEFPGTTGEINAYMFRYGIQPNIGYSGTYFTAAFSTRLVGLNYTQINGNLTYEGSNQVTYLNSNKSSFLIEPALTIRGGIEKVKLQLQVTRSFNLSHTTFMQDYSLFTIGLNFNL